MTTTTFENKIKQFDAIHGLKPEADEEFIQLFTDFLFKEEENYDIVDINDGAYFGKQIVIKNNRRYFSGPEVELEIAYDSSTIVVYTANHNGFWVPPYISLSHKHEKFAYVKESLMTFIKTKMGIE